MEKRAPRCRSHLFGWAEVTLACCTYLLSGFTTEGGLRFVSPAIYNLLLKVELVYPPLNGAADADIMSDDDEVINLPNKWGNLPSLALPDGAHNYQKDSIYFTLPSLEKEDVAVFGIASYRQVDSLVSLQCTHTRY
ncbi:unnamed protein product [Calicophoron daubneyi]|uniref:AVL9/DENND6 domain-containing protein n=1 Tax=Calicophoron daubneyi TaxID=300641 RepID=A0AAV2TJD0_CALDB